jgi:hypothetical protein
MAYDMCCNMFPCRNFLLFLRIALCPCRPFSLTMPPKDAANWTANPEDLANLLAFLNVQRSRVGEGGNWDRTVLNEAAAHMASLGPPAKGGPKTAAAIATKWGQVCSSEC